MRATDLAHIGHLYAAYGFSSQGFDVYLATGLDHGEPAHEAEEQDMIHRAFTDDEIDRFVLAGGIVDAPSLAVLTLYQTAPKRWTI